VKLFRAHGLGNDYLVLETGEPLDAPLVRAICDRHTGVGGDGLLEPVPSDRCEYGVRIWNPDGSVAEKSGNGLRIYARWLVLARGAPSAFGVDTLSCTVRCRVDGDRVEVEMGRATFEPDEVPLDDAEPLIEGPITIPKARLIATAVGLGNPHCVVFRDEPLDTLPWRAWGRALTSHPLFPNQTNVQIARVVDRHTLEIRIWERGAGETSASGSSSCGAVAAALRTGRIDAGDTRVLMPGGELRVGISPELDLLLEGPVEVIGRFELDSVWIERRIRT